MTEKEFRKIVFETELPSSKKQEFLEKITNIEAVFVYGKVGAVFYDLFLHNKFF